MFAANVPPYFWVKYGSGNAVRVSTDDCEDIDELIEDVKVKLSPELNNIPNRRIYIYTADHARNEALKHKCRKSCNKYK